MIKKTHKLTVAYAALIALMLAGSFATISSATTLEVKLFYLPWWVDLENPFPWSDTMVAVIYKMPEGYSVSDINPDTILLEGTLAPYKTSGWWFLFFASFDADDVLMLVWGIVSHYPPGKATIYLTITGEFYDGTPFEGSSKMIVFVDCPPPPPPP